MLKERIHVECKNLTAGGSDLYLRYCGLETYIPLLSEQTPAMLISNAKTIIKRVEQLEKRACKLAAEELVSKYGVKFVKDAVIEKTHNDSVSAGNKAWLNKKPMQEDLK